MSMSQGNVWSPVITPFGSDLSPDVERLVSHCRWLISQGVGLAVFGTNSEANSLTVVEKVELLEALVAAGIPADRLMPGTGSCSIGDTVTLSRRAVELGCAGVLMLPPFYYKGVSDEGLFRYYSEVIERIDDARLRVYLYHIPPVAQVSISLPLVERLIKAYPSTVVGIKDSSGDWSNTQALIDKFSEQGFHVYAGSERFLLATLRAGGAGCISATANVNPEAIARLGKTWQQSDADEQQASLNRVRAVFEQFQMIPALKAATGHYSGEKDWLRTRPPLVELSADRSRELFSLLDAEHFAMPDLPSTGV